ncbi:MAG: STT3 domain-containing protein [Candidatus Nanoarchaeia archaeon]
MQTAINKENVLKVCENKRFQWIAIGVIFLILLIVSVQIRTSNLPLLVDETTGEKLPLALDPIYFLRVAETKLNEGLPECDPLRALPDECKGWHAEILPDSSIFIYKIGKIFNNNFTIQYAHVLNPVIFFILGLIMFFFLVYILTHSKMAALLSSGFLAFIPTYLYRTMAGFSDHESIGMFAFFLFLLGFTLSLKYLDKSDGKGYVKPGLLGLGVGFLTAFTIASWGGISNFVFMILPLAMLIYWLVNRRESIGRLKQIFIFYFIWLVSSLLITPLISGHTFAGVLNKYLLSSVGLLVPVIFGFILIDLIVVYLKQKKKVNYKYDILYSVAILFILGLLFLIITGQLSLIGEVFYKILNPFGTGRLGETVAENQSPTLENWQNQTGPIFFWIFLIGLMFIGKEISKSISKIRKRRVVFIILWILMILGIIFSSHSVFSGSSLLRKVIYFGSVLLFLVYSGWLYLKENQFNIKPELIIIFSWMVFMLVGARGAIRLFFVITPFVVFSASLVPVKLFNYARANKDDIIKLLLWIGFIVVILALIFSFNNFYISSSSQASQTGPSANMQWQNAMSWVRDNTQDDAIFLHWWDYGYWVQYLGKRATLADGGHFQGLTRIHMIGRYVLTTPYPETALSFMKSNNATHLLIDPTDIGKYPAYSRIGSGEEMQDRLAQIPKMLSNPEQIQETSNGTIRLYQGGAMLYEDIIYEQDGKETFLPSRGAWIGGIQLETQQGEKRFKQPIGIFVYNNQRYELPLRYAYYDGEIYDFEFGINATAYVLPRIFQSSQGWQVDEEGALIYLSPKTMHSLVAELYLMDDVFDNYPTLELAHKEKDRVIDYLEAQGMQIGDFVYYGGLRGPIKIWDTTDIPEEIIAHKEFRQKESDFGDDWEYGMLDKLEFRR